MRNGLENLIFYITTFNYRNAVILSGRVAKIGNEITVSYVIRELCYGQNTSLGNFVDELKSYSRILIRKSRSVERFL